MTDNTITLTPVIGSSLIAADGWSDDFTVLHVQFKNGDTYEFPGLSPKIANGYETASSKGKYLKSVIEKNIQGRKI